MANREPPRTFLPAKNLFKKLKNRFFAPAERNRELLDDNIEYYLALMDFKEYVEEEVTATEQKLVDKFTEEDIDIVYLTSINVKVKFLKEYGAVFMVNDMTPADVFEARRHKVRREKKKKEAK